jgi:hypothetical protein
VADGSSGRLVLSGDTFPLQETIKSAARWAGAKPPRWNDALTGWVVDKTVEAEVLAAIRETGATVIDAAISKEVADAARAAAEAKAAFDATQAALRGGPRAPPPAPAPAPAPAPVQQQRAAPPAPAPAAAARKPRAPRGAGKAAAKAAAASTGRNKKRRVTSFPGEEDDPPADAAAQAAHFARLFSPPVPAAEPARAPKPVDPASIPRETLSAAALKVLIASDLGNVTARQVRRQLEAQLGCSLESRKMEVKKLTEELFEKAERAQKTAKRASAAAAAPASRARAAEAPMPAPAARADDGCIDLTEDEPPPKRAAASAPAPRAPAAAVEDDVIDLCDSDEEPPPPRRAAAAPPPSPRAGILDAVVAMGFAQAAAERAVAATGATNVGAAVEWLTTHDDADAAGADAAPADDAAPPAPELSPEERAAREVDAMAAAAVFAAATAKLEAAQAMQRAAAEKQRQQSAAATAARAAAAAAGRGPGAGRGAGGRVFGNVVYAGDVVGGGFGNHATGGWEGGGAMNLGGMDDFMAL